MTRPDLTEAERRRNAAALAAEADRVEREVAQLLAELSPRRPWWLLWAALGGVALFLLAVLLIP
jgi:hypothetical protein